MPIREYNCPDCGVFERLFRTAAEDTIEVDECPLCGRESERIEISQTGSPILTPGCGGFYRPSS